MGQGKEGIIDFTPGSELLVAKAKNGHLSVVSVLYHLLHHYQFYVFVSKVFTDVWGGGFVTLLYTRFSVCINECWCSFKGCIYTSFTVLKKTFKPAFF